LVSASFASSEVGTPSSGSGAGRTSTPASTMRFGAVAGAGTGSGRRGGAEMRAARERARATTASKVPPTSSAGSTRRRHIVRRTMLSIGGNAQTTGPLGDGQTHLVAPLQQRSVELRDVSTISPSSRWLARGVQFGATRAAAPNRDE